MKFIESKKKRSQFLSEQQEAELVTALAGRREIPLKLEYLGEGADRYVAISAPEVAGGSEIEIISQYKGLWQIEETFRISKHDLKVRPIYHWTEQKIRAHIAICFMALVCVRHLEYRVNLQKVKISPERIRKALTSVDITIVRHIKDKRLFAIPSYPSDDAKIIYKTMDIKISPVPYVM